MRKNRKESTRQKPDIYQTYFVIFLRWLGLEPTKNPWLRKILLGFLFFAVLVLGGMYGIAQWYISKHADEKLVYGATFIKPYAESFGLNPKEVLDAALNDLGLKRIRFVSYWNTHEEQQGIHDFSELDWQFAMAQEAGADVTLALGLRQPRWPECHAPQWAMQLPKEQWSKHLNQYIKAVVERYKDHPSLVSYQLENEYFLTVFGECPDHSKERLINEFNLVKSLDPDKPLTVTRSNNAVPSWPINEPLSDINGASIYKRVWDATITKRYFEYPVPAWFYAFLGGGAELTTGRNTFIHELQAEAWMPPNKIIYNPDTIPEQDKSLSPDMLADRLKYAEATGYKTIDIWGVEWWYWRKTLGDPSLWETAKSELQRVKSQQN
ncbi:hypothetical protein KY385_04820 [Candidatus Parcubacteria bacterium]|nr:hypothetical protein [Candidatus Parcubacteria bacterium]